MSTLEKIKNEIPANNRKQTANTILMIEPVRFGFNEQTSVNNYFQQNEQENSESSENIQSLALAEFNRMTDKLRSKGITIVVLKDTFEPHKPDSVFPNNWISFHPGGTIVLYPMFAPNRRTERRTEVFNLLAEKGFRLQKIVDYSSHENQNCYLEGTGSMVFDHVNRIAYMALSDRSDKDLFLRFCIDLGFKPVYFLANQTVKGKRLPVYHTNVMMCVADQFSVVCSRAIDKDDERTKVIDSLVCSGKEIIDISEKQMHCFTGNMLQVENDKGNRFLVLSQTAFDSLTQLQIETLTKYNELVPVSIPTIEKYGGGSVRCMMAEVFI